MEPHFKNAIGRSAFLKFSIATLRSLSLTHAQVPFLTVQRVFECLFIGGG